MCVCVWSGEAYGWLAGCQAIEVLNARPIDLLLKVPSIFAIIYRFYTLFDEVFPVLGETGVERKQDV